MFVQVIRAKAKDPGGLRKQWDAWSETVRAGAKGWLGATAGVTDDGQFVALVRFESAEAAKRNSERPEQGAWWAETEKLLSGAKFFDCPEVVLFLKGGSDDAGFVQVIEGRATDKAKAQALYEEMEKQLPSERPDVIGGTNAWAGDRFFDTVYFTSEAEARAGEKKPQPAGVQEWTSLVTDLAFLDIREPWVSSR